MDRLKSTGRLLFVISVIAILYALIFNPAPWMVYIIALVFIPLSIISLGLFSMARGKKEDEEGKTREPFIGY